MKIILKPSDIVRGFFYDEKSLDLTKIILPNLTQFD